jgi:hypothetical protein
MSRHTSVGIATDYGVDSRCTIAGRDNRFLFTPQRPYRLWGPLSLLSNGYQGLFARFKEAEA